jgi:hypothetical protein
MHIDCYYYSETSLLLLVIGGLTAKISQILFELSGVCSALMLVSITKTRP